MPGLGAVGGPCFRPVAGEPAEEGLLLPLSETKNSFKLTHTSKHQDTLVQGYSSIYQSYKNQRKMYF